MPKVEAIISQLQNKSFDSIPEVSHVFQFDIDRITEALKKQKNDRSYYAVLRVVYSEVKKKLGHKDYSKPLFQISLSQLEEKPYINDLRLRVCEAIIDCEQYHRLNFIQHTINTLAAVNLNDPLLKARLQIVRAGKQYFKGDYTKAAIYYLNSSKQEAFVKDDERKIFFINKAIAFSYVAPRSPENHKTICSLCMNQLSKKSLLREALNKLYTEDIMTKEVCSKLQKFLPASLGKADADGVSVLDQAKFLHNMIPIINTFKVIQFSTLSRLLSMKIEQVLILLEKTYANGQLKIHQEKELIQFTEQYEQSSQRLKELLHKIDELIENEK